MRGVFGGGGSMSTVSREETAAMSSEDSSSPDESELELGLGLSLGLGFNRGNQQSIKGGCYARVLPSGISAPSSTSSSSSTLRRSNGTAGVKRSADSVSAPNGASSQVVGWPPIRAYRMTTMANPAKSVAKEEYNSIDGKNKSNDAVMEHANNASRDSKPRTLLYVKVNMDGIAIGRKVDLSAHGSYEKLAQTLEAMFLRPPPTINTIRLSASTRCPKLLDESSDFVLTYEDKEGDWMLVGDVPWGMFVCTVKRLRIMRSSEATGLAPRLEERDGRQRRKPMPI